MVLQIQLHEAFAGGRCLSVQDRIRGDASRTTLICVDSYAQRVPQGRYYCGREEQGGTFQSLSQLLVGMEHNLDSANIPQSFTAVRSFSVMPEEKQREIADENARNGELATFAVRIFFRQHTSWQGSVTWLEERCEQPFRSVLELILLMDSALGGCQESPRHEDQNDQKRKKDILFTFGIPKVNHPEQQN